MMFQDSKGAEQFSLASAIEDSLSKAVKSFSWSVNTSILLFLEIEVHCHVHRNLLLDLVLGQFTSLGPHFDVIFHGLFSRAVPFQYYFCFYLPRGFVGFAYIFVC